MRITGYISDYTPSKGGFGKIRSEEQLEVRFERFECNYDTIRINDKVHFDLVKSFDGIFDALNIEFVSNSDLKELDNCFQKQLPIPCYIQYNTPKGFVVSYKNITLFLPEKFCFGEEITVGETKEFFVHTFSYDNNLIATIKRVKPEGLIETFAQYINTKQTLLFEVVEVGEHGLLLGKDGYIGFVPNSHIVPLEKNKIKIGEELFGKVIGCSISTGLVISIRNHYAEDSLEKLKKAYENEDILKGTILSNIGKAYVINYNDLKLKMNVHHLALNNIQIGEEIQFKIIEFSTTKDISVSNIEVTKFGLLRQLRTSNYFTATVVSIRENGVFLKLNMLYYNAFLPVEDLTEISDKKMVLEKIGINSVLHCSISRFNCYGIYVSRLKYKKKKRQEKASNFWKVNDRVRLKIKDKMAMFGLLVENENLKGLIPMNEILPDEVKAKIDLLLFVKFAKNIFRKRIIISAVITKVDKENNQFFFALDLMDSEVKINLEKVLSYFSYDMILRNRLENFLNQKKQEQETIFYDSIITAQAK